MSSETTDRKSLKRKNREEAASVADPAKNEPNIKKKRKHAESGVDESIAPLPLTDAALAQYTSGSKPKKSKKSKDAEGETVVDETITEEPKAKQSKKNKDVEAASEETIVGDDATESKKSKKEKKAKKEKKEEADVNETLHITADEPAPTATAAEAEGKPELEVKKSKKDKKSKKSKTDKPTSEDVTMEEAPASASTAVAEETLAEPAAASSPAAPAKEGKKSKKSRKSKSTDTETPETPVAVGEVTTTEGAATEDGDTKAKHRFICFIGNLPFSATEETITAHFSKLSPFTVRLRTDKATGKPRGFAFLEFPKYDAMKTCLKMFHHSEFDDGSGKPRKINVELTAGGGGKTEGRMEKVREKNVKLDEERERRRIEEEKAAKRKEAKEAKEGGKKGGKGGKGEKEGGKKEEKKVEVVEDQSGIHPSRRAQMSY